MEPGPAASFSQAQMSITTEPSLAANSGIVDFGNIDAVHNTLTQIESDLTAAHAELKAVGEDLAVHISAVAGAIDNDLAGTEPNVPGAITDQFDLVQQAIDGAESSFVAEAFTETPPWYQPPSEEEPAPAVENNPRGTPPA